MGKIITHENALDIKHGPLQAMTQQVNTILDSGGNEEKLLRDYVSTERFLSTITYNQIRTLVRAEVRSLDLGKRGISCEIVGNTLFDWEKQWQQSNKELQKQKFKNKEVGQSQHYSCTFNQRLVYRHENLHAYHKYCSHKELQKYI